MARVGGISGQYTGDLGAFVGLLGSVPPLKAAASTIGGVLYIYSLINQAAAGLLPSSFDHGAADFDIEDSDELFEDDEGGSWANFRVTAVSTGWKLDQAILAVIATIAGFEDLGGFPTVTEGLAEVAANLAEFAINSTVAQVIGAVAGGESFVEVCPNIWPDIDVSEHPYSEAFVFGSSVELIGRTSFETREPGVSETRLATVGGLFGDAPPVSKVKPVEVLTIMVDVDPADVRLETETEHSFTATVRNAHDDRVRWIVPDGLESLGTSNFGRTIRIKTPEDPWDPLSRSRPAASPRRDRERGK